MALTTEPVVFETQKRDRREGEILYAQADNSRRRLFDQTFRDSIRTEELKAWYGEPEGNSLFQGTFVSSLTIPCSLNAPLPLSGIDELEESIADHYIRLHDAHEKTVRQASLESVDKWMAEGLFFGVAPRPERILS